MLYTSSYSSDNNATAVLYGLLNKLKARVTLATVREKLEQHPDFPNLFSFTQVLSDWRIDNTALQLNTTEQLRELPLPFIAHLRRDDGLYVLVTEVKGDAITYSDLNKEHKIELLVQFEQKWSGVVLVAELNEHSGETNYRKNHYKEIAASLRWPFVLTSTIFLLFLAVVNPAKTLSAIDYTWLLTKVAGILTSMLLLAKQFGSNNKLLDHLCQINSKTDCNNIFNSPAAKLWGWLSWAEIGLVYFAGGLLMVLMSLHQPETKSLLSYLSLTALLYTFFSIFYQAWVARKWCLLCLFVQSILIIESALAIHTRLPLPDQLQPYLILLSSFLLPTILWISIRPLLKTASRNEWEHNELMRFKYNYTSFQALLRQNPQMPSAGNNVHPIILGHSDAAHTITIITNPYCGPCAKAHSALEKILASNADVNAQLIFATFDGGKGPSTQVALHVLALVNQAKIAEAIKDWYEQDEKNFDAWTKRHPIETDPTDWMAVVDQHSQWCLTAGTTATPTIFIDGYQLPDLYQLEDLRWLIYALESKGTETVNFI